MSRIENLMLPVKYLPWSATEEDELRRMFDDGLPTNDIAWKLGRTLAAVHMRLSRLGLRRNRFWSRRSRPVEPIARLVCRYYGLTLTELRTGRRKTKRDCRPRQIAIWLGTFQGCTYSHMGRYFGRDYSTAIAAAKRIQLLRARNSELRELSNALLSALRGEGPEPPSPYATGAPEPVPEPMPKTPVSDDPGEIEPLFYDQCGKNSRKYLVKQNERFLEALQAAGERP